jgi:hypothetical protein
MSNYSSRSRREQRTTLLSPAVEMNRFGLEVVAQSELHTTWCLGVTNEFARGTN